MARLGKSLRAPETGEMPPAFLNHIGLRASLQCAARKKEGICARFYVALPSFFSAASCAAQYSQRLRSVHCAHLGARAEQTLRPWKMR